MILLSEKSSQLVKSILMGLLYLEQFVHIIECVIDQGWCLHEVMDDFIGTKIKKMIFITFRSLKSTYNSVGFTQCTTVRNGA